MTDHLQYPTQSEASIAMMAIGKSLHQRGFTAANDGNFSCKLSQNTILTTPTGVSKGSLTAEMLVVTDLEGNMLSGSARPSSELQLHLRIYHENPAIFRRSYSPRVSSSWVPCPSPLMQRHPPLMLHNPWYLFATTTALCFCRTMALSHGAHPSQRPVTAWRP